MGNPEFPGVPEPGPQPIATQPTTGTGLPQLTVEDQLAALNSQVTALQTQVTGLQAQLHDFKVAFNAHWHDLNDKLIIQMAASAVLGTDPEDGTAAYYAAPATSPIYAVAWNWVYPEPVPDSAQKIQTTFPVVQLPT